MDWLEQELKQALRRKEPSPDFSVRVAAAAARPRRPLVMPKWIGVAASVVFICGGGLAWRHHEGVVAKEQVMLAMKITAGKLNHIQTRVKEMRP
jgi:hypothetical protein